jgi:hypothetical protein
MRFSASRDPCRGLCSTERGDGAAHVPNSTAVGQNKLLGGLGGDDLVRLHPKKVAMTLGDLLHPVGAPIEHVYFPESGMVSMLTVMKSGEQIETAIIGSEGVIGGWVAIDGGNTNTQSTVQVKGVAQQVSAARFLETYRVSDTFRSAMNAYQGIILFQAQQSAGCHAIHTVEARLCRWLLLSQDILGIRARSPDPGISIAHARRPTVIGVAVRTHFAEVWLNPVRARQYKDPKPQGPRRMCL